MAGGRAPRIGLSWLRPDDPGAAAYAGAVSAAGGRPVLLSPAEESWDAELASLDGLVLTGGNAVDPRRYGQEDHGLCRVVIPRRDALEETALRLCLARERPVLGICRGMQFINVARGGSMLQDLAIGTVEHEGTGDRSRFHRVDVLPDTRLAAIAGAAGDLTVNSRHHQGLRPEHVAPEMRITAIAPDGVVEGIEAVRGGFLMGVQFHPEIPGEVPQLAGLITSVVAFASRE